MTRRIRRRRPCSAKVRWGNVDFDGEDVQGHRRLEPDQGAAAG
ncbi:hypothetical protein ACRAWD_23260 [Caulobacter segnis]